MGPCSSEHPFILQLAIHSLVPAGTRPAAAGGIGNTAARSGQVLTRAVHTPSLQRCPGSAERPQSRAAEGSTLMKRAARVRPVPVSRMNSTPAVPRPVFRVLRARTRFPLGKVFAKIAPLAWTFNRQPMQRAASTSPTACPAPKSLSFPLPRQIASAVHAPLKRSRTPPTRPPARPARMGRFSQARVCQCASPLAVHQEPAALARSASSARAAPIKIRRGRTVASPQRPAYRGGMLPSPPPRRRTQIVTLARPGPTRERQTPPTAQSASWAKPFSHTPDSRAANRCERAAPASSWWSLLQPRVTERAPLARRPRSQIMTMRAAAHPAPTGLSPAPTAAHAPRTRPAEAAKSP